MKAPAVPAPRDVLVYYGLPILLAALVHVAAGLALMEGWGGSREPERILFRESISAHLLAVEAAAPEPEPEARQPRRQPEPQQRQPARQQPLPTEAAPARPEPPPARVTTPEVEPRLVPQPEPDRRWQEELAETFSRALDAEAERLATRQADAATASYIGAIVNQIERHWSRPPSTRSGMQAELMIDLVPTGEVARINVTRSSGNAAFDRSAELAVRQAAPFSVPDDPALFERRFRQLRLLFTPEDLRNR